MPTCDICGSRHDTENGVVQHIYMSGGEHEQWDNKGEIWKNAGDLVNESDNGGSVNDNEPEGSEDPTMGSGEGASSSSSTFETPCGHETVDVDEDIPEDAIVDGETVWTCGTCEKSWKVSV